MFPRGTEELPLPPHMRRIETARGVFHFDPLRLSAADIERASAEGRENEILGLGPLSKADVADVSSRTGEWPVAITERDRDGNEVRASMATPSTVGMQSDEILRTAAPDNIVDVEPVESVVGRRGEMGMGDSADRAMRLARADGGPIPFASDVDDTRWHPGAMSSRSIGAYDPTYRDKVADFVRSVVAGPDSRDPSVNRFVGHLVGSDGLSRDGFTPASAVPVVGAAEGAINVAESAVRGNVPRAASNFVLATVPSIAGRYANRWFRNGDERNAAMEAGKDSWLKDIGQGFTVRRQPTPGTPESLGRQGFHEEANAMRAGQSASAPRASVSREAQYEADIARLESERLARLARLEREMASEPAAAYKAGDLKILAEPSHVKQAREWGGPEAAPPPEWRAAVRDFWSMTKPDKLHADGGRVDAISTGGIAPMATAGGSEPEDMISPMGGMMQMKAGGGGIGVAPIVGSLVGATGGRADKIPGTARPGSHVLPADIVSHMGQGNTNAGLRALEKMFKTGPYGMSLGRRRQGFADGGEVGEGEIPVMLSDGEFVIPPEVVASVGGGDVATGHDVIDAWILDERQKHIQTLQALPPPATD